MFLTVVAFAGAAALLAMVPGPSTAVVIRQTLRGGRRAAFAATVANEIGILFWALTATFGLSVLVAASQSAYEITRYVGAGVLIVLGVQSILNSRHNAQDGAGGEMSDAAPPADTWHAFRIGLVTILANPKAAVFAASFLPQFVPRHGPVLATMALLSFVWVIVDALWYVVLAWAVNRVRGLLSRPAVRRGMERAAGVVLIGFGLRLAAERL